MSAGKSSGKLWGASRWLLPRWRLAVLVVIAAVIVLAPSVALAQGATAASEELGGDLQRGQQLYQSQCASCHGGDGQGVAGEYEQPLEGDFPQLHLLEIIEETMPADEPEACVGQDARDVTAYVFEQFYGEMARLRRQATRIDLSRLTVAQYRNSVTDLLLTLDPAAAGAASTAEVGEPGGLTATYYKSRRLRNSDRVLRRVDPVVDFDFGTAVPAPDQEFDNPEEFSIRWEGGLFVEQTGEYTIGLQSENGVRLWVNDRDTPLIDAWVRSGERTERSETLFLLGGRTYPVRLDFFKFNDARASISLRWAPQGKPLEPIAARHLRQGTFPALFVVTTPFPPDDRSVGYERGSSVSKPWAEATTHSAVETAHAIAGDLDRLAGVAKDDDEAARRDKVRKFCRRLVQLAFRRPLAAADQQRFIDQHFEQAESLEHAVRRVVILALQSPRFLYPGLDLGDGDDHDVATRLSYALWDSLPDAALLEAAQRGELSTPAEVTAQARRMLQDARARTKLRGFFHHWLHLDAVHDFSKDPQAYPDFDAALVADLRASLDRFIAETVWGESSDFRQLLLADRLWVNHRLAAFYGLPEPEQGADAGEREAEAGEFQPVSGGDQRRAGILTHPYLMAALSHHNASSPIHRGVFMVRSILGRALRDPPVAIEIVDPGMHPELTTRQRVGLQTKPANCQACHAVIDPLGFALEHFDAVGRYRSEELAQPIDASGSLRSLDGQLHTFRDARELAEALAQNAETHRSFVNQLFEYLIKQPVRAYGADQLDALTTAFHESDCRVDELVVQCVATAALATADAP